MSLKAGWAICLNSAEWGIIRKARLSNYSEVDLSSPSPPRKRGFSFLLFLAGEKAGFPLSRE
jgi:hypothetical protein